MLELVKKLNKQFKYSTETRHVYYKIEGGQIVKVFHRNGVTDKRVVTVINL